MEATDAIDVVRAEIAEARSKGHAVVSIDGLDKLLVDLRASTEPSMEHYKLKYQGALAEYDAKIKHNLEMLKGTLEAGKEALSAIVLTNGGAVVALLGFLGAALAKDFPRALGLRLTVPLLCFGIGVLLGALAFGARYLSQAFYAGGHSGWGQGFTLAAVVIAVVAYATFGWALWNGYQSFRVAFMS
jgi:hypothetical protein